MKTIDYQMSAEQTAIYDGNNDMKRDQMWREIRAEIKAAPETYGDYVEVRTTDGIVAEVVDLRD